MEKKKSDHNNVTIREKSLIWHFGFLVGKKPLSITTDWVLLMYTFSINVSKKALKFNQRA